MGKIGIHTFVWTDGLKQEDLELALNKTAEHGFEVIELAYLRPENFNLDRLGKLAQSLGVTIGVSMGLDVNSDISSDDDSIVAAGAQVLTNAVNAVRDLGGDKLGGILHSAHTKYNKFPTERGWKNSTTTIAKIADYAKTENVGIVVEVVNRFESNLLNTTAQGLKYLEDAASDNISLHLDTFHMNIEEANPAAAVRLAGDKIGYFHIGESNRGFLGCGSVDFDSIFDALVDINYQKDIVFESFSGAIVDKALSLACGIWRDTWTNSDELAAHAKQFIGAKLEEAKRRRTTNLGL